MKPVYLVGAGPGDPELITCKGRGVLERADVVLYDHLANEALLRLAPAAAERIYVGKKKAVHAPTQEEICAMMIERARRGLTVVRLKGGDPFIFGRGGEEAEALADAGIPFRSGAGRHVAAGDRRLRGRSADASRSHVGGDVRHRARCRADRLEQGRAAPRRW